MTFQRIGPEFQINQDTPNIQREPDTATLTDGRFAVTYERYFTPAGLDLDVIGQILNPNGTLSGGTLLIYHPGGLQYTTAVAARPDGGFTTVWSDFGSVSGSPTDGHIYAAVTNSAGDFGSRIAIATFAKTKFNVDIATLQDGRQIIVFENVVTENTNEDMYFNVLNPNGTVLFAAGSGQGVIQSDTSRQIRPAVAASGNNALLVYEDGAGDTDRHITGRIFNGATNTILSSIEIANHGTDLLVPDAAAISGNRYVVTYHNRTSVFARIYDPSTNLLGPEKVVATGGSTEHQFISPRVVASPDGGFMVAYSLDSPSPTDIDVHVRRFDVQGNPASGDFLVNTFTDGNQTRPTISVSGANILITWTDVGPRTEDSSGTGVRGQIFKFETANDFNGDSKSDVLFSIPGTNFNSDYMWQMNDRSIASQGAIDLYDKAFNVQVVGDFDGDGKSDVLFRNPNTGGVWQWLLDGTSIKSQGAVDVADPAFALLGSADFNGDGKSDLLFRNAAGYVYMWQMDGRTNTPLAVGPLDPSWHVAGAGDFDGDGKADLLLHNISNSESNGAYFLWKMNGNQIIGEGGIERPDASWHTLAVGDFDGDGKSDIAIRNESASGDNGAVWVYLMAGVGIKSQGAAGIVKASEFNTVGVGDYSGDGRDDILFRNAAGYFYSWDMDGKVIQTEGAFGTQAGNFADPAIAVVTQHWDLV